LKQTTTTTFKEGKQGPPLERACSNERDGKQGDHSRQHNKKRREEKENESTRKNRTEILEVQQYNKKARPAVVNFVLIFQPPRQVKYLLGSKQ